MSAIGSVDDVHAAIDECVRTVFPFLSEEDLPAATRESVEEWDSLATLSLITLVEETLDLTLTDDDVQQLDSVEAIKRVVVARWSAAA